MRQKKALVLSPFATVPPDAGQRKRALQTTRILKEMGFDVTFFLYAFEEGWGARANENWLDEMRGLWHEVIVLHANPKVGAPPLKWGLHGIDEWWDDVIEAHLKEIFAYRFFDVFVVHNVWLSKAFDFAPRGTVRILDSHDVFSMRVAYFDPAKGSPEFFLTSASAEAFGASRADIVLGIQDNDAEWFARNAKGTSLCLPYGGDQARPDRPRRQDYLHEDKVVFGFLGSGHVFNIRGLAVYCDELMREVGRTAAPVELRIGGQICRSIKTRGPWVLCGKIDDEDAFFDEVDIVVAPVFEGTGFKVKVADAASREMPIIAAEHAAIGLDLDRRAIARTASELARITANIALHRPPYAELTEISRQANLDLQARTARAVRKLGRKIATWPCSILYDLTGLTEKEAACVLLSWSGAFYQMRFVAKQLVVAPDSLRAELEGLAPAGVFFVSEHEVNEYARQIWHWITVTNLNPENWGAPAEQTWIDLAWRGALGDEADPDPSPTEHEPETSMFWHNVTWDPLFKQIVKKAAGDPANAVRRKGETLFIASAQGRAVLESSAETLFPDLRIVGLDSFDEFYELMIRVVSGELRRLVVASSGHPARSRILRQLCAIKGIEFVGLIGQGGLSFGALPEQSVKRIYTAFEKQWRLQKDDAMVPSATA